MKPCRRVWVSCCFPLVFLDVHIGVTERLVWSLGVDGRTPLRFKVQVEQLEMLDPKTAAVFGSGLRVSHSLCISLPCSVSYKPAWVACLGMFDQRLPTRIRNASSIFGQPRVRFVLHLASLRKPNILNPKAQLTAPS